jgi:hypothetical protein
MTFTALHNRPRTRHRARLWPLVLGAVAGTTALVLVIYLLWPTWSGTSAEMADRFPITVGGTLFDVPRDAIRVSVQRRSGDQERVDLAFQYPSLTPPAPQAPVTAETAEQTPVAIDRIFVTLAAHNGEMAPAERVRTIYPRYLDPFQQGNTDGLTRAGFRDGSPYHHEDMFGDSAGKFLARCTRDAVTPGTCTSERRVGGADITFRFPRAWLKDWRDVAGAIEQLNTKLVKTQQ